MNKRYEYRYSSPTSPCVNSLAQVSLFVTDNGLQSYTDISDICCGDGSYSCTGSSSYCSQIESQIRAQRRTNLPCVCYANGPDYYWKAKTVLCPTGQRLVWNESSAADNQCEPCEERDTELCPLGRAKAQCTGDPDVIFLLPPELTGFTTGLGQVQLRSQDAQAFDQCGYDCPRVKGHYFPETTNIGSCETAPCVGECNAGYFYEDCSATTLFCQECTRDRFSRNPSKVIFTGPGTDHLDNCPFRCDYGYEVSGEEGCALCTTDVCPAGQFLSTCVGSTPVCEPCDDSSLFRRPANSNYVASPALSMHCPWVCGPGYYGIHRSYEILFLPFDQIATTEAAEECTICEIGFYCPGDGKRYECSVGESTVAEGQSECSTCPANFYCQGGSAIPCGTVAESDPGSDSVSDCRCENGFDFRETTSGTVCLGGALGVYCPEGGGRVQCPLGKTSLSLANSESDCGGACADT